MLWPKYCITKVNKDGTKVLYYKKNKDVTRYCITKVNRDVMSKVSYYKSKQSIVLQN